MSTFAENLRAAMEEKQITQAELSKRTGISKSFISQYLSGKFKPREDKLSMLAQTLGTTKGALLGYENPGHSKVTGGGELTEVEVFSADEPDKPWGSELIACEPGNYRFYICRDDKNRPFVMFGDHLLVSVDEIGGSGLYAVTKNEQGGKVYFNEMNDPRKEAAERGLKIIGRVCELRRKFL
mgnify:CR=1 FL=1